MATIERRRASDGTTRFRVKVRLLGEKPRTKTFRRKTDADAWAKATESDLARGAYVPTTSDRRRTLAELIDKCIKEHLPTKRNNKSADKVAAQLEWWKSELGSLSLDKLSAQAIAGARSKLLTRKAKRGARLSPATANRYLAALSVATKWGWKELGWLRRNPVLDVTKGAESSGVVRFLSDAERVSLLDAARADADPNVYTAIVLALCTGQRAGNLASLDWDDVDLERKAIRLRDTKAGEGRWVPLVDIAAKALEAHLERDPTRDGWVFKSTTRDTHADINGMAWLRVKRAAGLTGAANLRFHDLRHTAGTYLNEAGATPIQIAAALGHKTLAMAQRYSHQSAEFTRSVFDKLSERIGEKSTREGGTSTTSSRDLTTAKP